MKKNPLAIRLEFKKNILFETVSPEISENITIGRAHDCTWVIPVEDSLASGHHAVITMKKNRLYVCDTGSRNGIFFKGQRMTEKLLQPGDAIAIGDCLLIVEKAVIRKAGGVNRIQFLSGPDSGKIMELHNARYVIGSAPGCDILLMNQLVSRKHAEIEVRPDGCWITDAGAKNGTLVNGTRLKPDTERLLKDSDIISIAQFDLKYLDSTVVHTQSRLWHSLLVMAATALAVLSCYYLYIRINPSAFDLLRQAREAAAEGVFDRAEMLLNESVNCRGAEDCRLRGEELRRDIENWRETVRQWAQIQQYLTAGQWTDAARGLGVVDPAQLNLWSWNDNEAAAARKQAATAKHLLDTYLTTRLYAQNDDRPLETLRTQTSSLRRALADAEKQKLPFMEKLNGEARQLIGELEADIAANDEVERIVARLAEERTPYDAIIADLEAMLKKSRGALHLKIEKLLLPIRSLQKSNEQLLAAVKNISSMQFDKNIASVLPLPPLEQCQVNPNIATLRRRQNELDLSLRETATRLQYLTQSLAKYDVTNALTTPPQIACFFDDKVMAEVLRCDVFDKAMPSRLRTAPAGEYDRLLGIEPFFDYLYSLPMEFDPAVYEDLQFPAQIMAARETYRKMEDLLAFFAQDRNMIFCRGELGAFKGFIDEQILHRSQLVAKLTAMPMTNREGLIANGIALFLAGKRDLPAEAPEQYKQALQAYRQQLLQLDKEFSTALPERAIQIRDDVLRLGIPGDPLVRKMWAKR